MQPDSAFSTLNGILYSGCANEDQYFLKEIYREIGYYYEVDGDITNAIKYYQKNIQIAEEQETTTWRV